MDVFRPLWCEGGGGSEVRRWEGLVNTCIHIVSEDATLPGSGVKWKKKRLLKHTHAWKIAYWSLLPSNVLLFFFYKYTHVAVRMEEPELKELTLQFQTKPKAQKAHPHSAECRTAAAEHCRRLSTLHLKGSPFSCTASSWGSTLEECNHHETRVQNKIDKWIKKKNRREKHSNVLDYRLVTVSA